MIILSGSSAAALHSCKETAEEYLVNVFHKSTKCKNFNELRYQIYHWSTAKCDLEKLPPTSASTALHIYRAYYVTYQQVNCLNPNAETLDPLQYGYSMVDNVLLPQKIYILLPPADEFVPSCRCTTCSRASSCCCLAAQVPCISFCLCQKNDTCKNKYNGTKD